MMKRNPGPRNPGPRNPGPAIVGTRNPGPAIVGTGDITEIKSLRESAICLHTPAVAWNLFHAKATRVPPRQHPRLPETRGQPLFGNRDKPEMRYICHFSLCRQTTGGPVRGEQTKDTFATLSCTPHTAQQRVAPCGSVWIEIHTPAVTWNLFHAEATRVDPLAGELSYLAFSCGLKSTLRP
jgi:hypothetical protein